MGMMLARQRLGVELRQVYGAGNRNHRLRSIDSEYVAGLVEVLTDGIADNRGPFAFVARGDGLVVEVVMSQIDGLAVIADYGHLSLIAATIELVEHSVKQLSGL